MHPLEHVCQAFGLLAVRGVRHHGLTGERLSENLAYKEPFRLGEEIAERAFVRYVPGKSHLLTYLHRPAVSAVIPLLYRRSPSNVTGLVMAVIIDTI